jgi:hypothetical protein
MQKAQAEALIFWLTTASAAASLVSIAAMEILLGAAVLLWIVFRPVPLRWPSYFLPLAVFMATTLLSLAMSPDPGVGWHPVQKVVLFSMGLLAAAFVTTESRAKNAYRFLLAAATVSAVMAIIQFGLAQAKFLQTGELADDPTLLNRITGPLGHWMTFSGVELLVWCAAIPAIWEVGQAMVLLQRVHHLWSPKPGRRPVVSDGFRRSNAFRSPLRFLPTGPPHDFGDSHSGSPMTPFDRWLRL